MKKYAITGGIASGKSTFCEWIKMKNLPLIDCDELIHTAYKPEGPIFKAVLESFGKEYLDFRGHIDRRRLGREIFQNMESRIQLNHITHPIVRRLVLEEVMAYEWAGKKVIFVDVPLLFESGLQEDYDASILIDIEKDLQIERLMKRNQFNFDEAISRIESQMPLSEKRKLATYVIRNDSTIEVFQNRSLSLIEQLLSEKA